MISTEHTYGKWQKRSSYRTKYFCWTIMLLSLSALCLYQLWENTSGHSDSLLTVSVAEPVIALWSDQANKQQPSAAINDEWQWK